MAISAGSIAKGGLKVSKSTQMMGYGKNYYGTGKTLSKGISKGKAINQGVSNSFGAGSTVLDYKSISSHDKSGSYYISGSPSDYDYSGPMCC